MEQAKIDRINELAKKAKSQEGLTPEESAEREQLRREYVAAFRDSLTAQLDSTYVVGPDGVKRPLKKKESSPISNTATPPGRSAPAESPEGPA